MLIAQESRWLCVLFAALAVGCATSTPKPMTTAPPKPVSASPDLSVARPALVEDLKKGTFERFRARFSKKMAEVLPPGKAKENWEDRLNRYGGLKGTKSLPTAYSAVFTCAFEEPKGLRVNVGDGNRVVGIFFAGPLDKKMELESVADQHKPAIAAAATFMQQFSSGNFTNAVSDFSPEMKKALPPDAIKGLWNKFSSGKNPRGSMGDSGAQGSLGRRGKSFRGRSPVRGAGIRFVRGGGCAAGGRAG